MRGLIGPGAPPLAVGCAKISIIFDLIFTVSESVLV